MEKTISYLLRATSTEVEKIRNTLGIWSTILFPLLIVFINFMIFMNHPELLSKGETNPWLSFMNNIVNIWTIAFMPMFIAIVTFYINFTDHKANGWRYIYSLPIPKSSIYFAKFLISLLLVSITMIVLFFLSYLGIQLLSSIHPDVPFNKFSSINNIMLTFIKITIASLGIIAIQFVAAILFKNFFIPIGLGVLATITSMFLLSWENIIYYPYAFPFFSGQDLMKGNFIFFNQSVIFGLISGAIIITAGYFIHIGQRIK